LCVFAVHSHVDKLRSVYDNIVCVYGWCRRDQLENLAPISIHCLHCIPPLSSQFNRRDQIVYNRLRIGHSYPTHSYLLHNDPQPLCISCHSPFSIEHILTECIDFQPIRVNYYSTSDMSELFNKVHPSSILQYMKDICLYNKL